MTQNRMIIVSLTLTFTFHNVSSLPYVVAEILARLSPRVTWKMKTVFKKLVEFAKDISMLSF